jgi:polyisoprenoid-binding protein YceI
MNVSRFPSATLAVAAFLTLAPLAAGADQVLNVAPADSVLAYKIVHTLHQVEATSSQLEGKALAKSDGTVQVMVRAKVAGFASGDTNRDEHMMEVMEAASYPTVTFKGLAKIAPATTYPAQYDVPLTGELEMHGQKFPETINVHVVMSSAIAWTVTGTFDVSLDKYKVERPALLLKKIDDACHMTLKLSLRAAP